MMDIDTQQSRFVIETEALWRVYKLNRQNEVAALRGVDLKIEPGHLVVLRGRSGSGKTTLLNVLGGLDRPTSGQVRIFGQDLHALSDQRLTLWRRQQIGFIFQSYGLLPTLSALENVEFVLRLTGMNYRERAERVLDCLRLVGLEKWMHHRPYELSGGQNQRIAIARAIAHRPQLILADEPTGELDSATAGEIMTLFRNIVTQDGVSLLMTSHDPLVDEFADRVIQLQDGHIV